MTLPQCYLVQIFLHNDGLSEEQFQSIIFQWPETQIEGMETLPVFCLCFYAKFHRLSLKPHDPLCQKGTYT